MADQQEVPEGYRRFARVTVGFDGGNFPVKGDLWSCRRCGAVIYPADQELHDRHHGEIDSCLESHNQVAEPSHGTGELAGFDPDTGRSGWDDWGQ